MNRADLVQALTELTGTLKPGSKITTPVLGWVVDLVVGSDSRGCGVAGLFWQSEPNIPQASHTYTKDQIPASVSSEERRSPGNQN